MPCSVASSSSWLPPTPLFLNASKKSNHPANYKLNHHHHQPTKLFLCLVNSPSLSINPPSKTPNPSTTTTNHLNPIQSPFNLTQTHFNSTPKSPSNGETQQRQSRSRAEHFAEKIRETPVAERSEFVNSMVLNHGGSKPIAYFNDLIMGLLITDELNLALKLFDEMPLNNITPDWWTYSIFIRHYCNKTQPDEGKKLLDKMIENRFRPNVVTLTILVNSFCSRGRVQRAIEVLVLMDRFGCSPNVHTYNCVLKGLCFVGRIEEAYKMLMRLKTKGGNHNNAKPDIYSYTAVMDGLCKVGRSDEAMELLNEAISMGLTPNSVTYNTLFNGYCKEGNPRNGIKLLKQMKERGCEPDYISYNTVLHGLLKWGKTMAAFWVYKEMVELGLRVDERVMNTLLRGLCRKSRKDEELFEKVYQVFDQMKSWVYVIYPDTYNLVIHTFCIGKKVDKGLVSLNEMVRAGFFPRMVTVNRVIRGLCEEGRVREALSVLVLVCETSRIPSKIGYNLLIDEFNRQGRLLGASSVYGAALKLGVKPHRKPLCVQRSR